MQKQDCDVALSGWVASQLLQRLGIALQDPREFALHSLIWG